MGWESRFLTELMRTALKHALQCGCLMPRVASRKVMLAQSGKNDRSIPIEVRCFWRITIEWKSFITINYFYFHYLNIPQSFESTFIWKLLTAIQALLKQRVNPLEILKIFIKSEWLQHLCKYSINYNDNHKRFPVWCEAIPQRFNLRYNCLLALKIFTSRQGTNCICAKLYS